METITAIETRRSIRKYTPDPICREDILKIIGSALKAPSAKNRQPWRFVVVTGESKKGMLLSMREGLLREESDPLLPGSARYLSGARHTLSIMEEAPVTLFIINKERKTEDLPVDMESYFYQSANLQSLGACIQNMLLAATELGYGSLWNCDIFFAYREISAWLETDEQVVAAVSFGVPAENPAARPRKSLGDTVEWKAP